MLSRYLRADRNTSLFQAAVIALVGAALAWAARNGPSALPRACGAWIVPVMLALWVGALLVRVVLYWRYPERHPLLRNLVAFGPPRKVAAAIDADFAAGPSVCWGRVPRGPIVSRAVARFVVVTPNWFVHCATDVLWAIPLAEFGWIYKVVTAEGNFLRPTSYRHSIVVMSRDRSRWLELPARGEVEAEEIAETLIRARPECLTGYRGVGVDLAANPDDLRREVDRRRELVAKMTTAARMQWIDERLDELDDFPRRVDPNAPETMAGA
jgi:hypothetical protein